MALQKWLLLVLYYLQPMTVEMAAISSSIIYSPSQPMTAKQLWVQCILHNLALQFIIIQFPLIN